MKTILFLLMLAADAAEPVFKTSQGLAIEGYDAVAFFEDGAPKKGSAEFVTTWKGATWRFASAAHRDKFAAEPVKYAPQYGGYCAWAAGHGYVYRADPEAFTVRDGKLYLNYSKDVRAKWLPDAAKWIAEGDKNWPKLHK